MNLSDAENEFVNRKYSRKQQTNIQTFLSELFMIYVRLTLKQLGGGGGNLTPL